MEGRLTPRISCQRSPKILHQDRRSCSVVHFQTSHPISWMLLPAFLLCDPHVRGHLMELGLSAFRSKGLCTGGAEENVTIPPQAAHGYWQLSAR